MTNMWKFKQGLSTDVTTIGDTVSSCQHLIRKLLAKYGGDAPPVGIDELRRQVREPREYRRVTLQVIFDVLIEHGQGWTLREIAEEHCLSKPTISNIINRKRAFADMPADRAEIEAWHKSKNRGAK